MFKAYMTDTVYLVKDVGGLSWGEKSTKEVKVKARVEYKNKMVRDFAGEQVVSGAQVFMEDRELKASDKIKIDGKEHPILNLLKHRAFGRHKTLEVQLG